MIENTTCELITKLVKDNDGIVFEFQYFIELNSEERNKLKDFRENFAKTSPIHFNFEESKFLFSQKKYFKKNQFINDPPNLDEAESKFLNDVTTTLERFKNFLNFDKIENIEKRKTVSI